MARYVLTLEAKAGTDEIRMLRAALKTLGRRFGLRCVEIRQEGAQSPTNVRPCGISAEGYPTAAET